MNSIGVAIATYNEEKNITRCIKSLEKWVNEIVVVDGESKDETVKILKKFKVKIISETNKRNFHINKQKAIDNLRTDWILQLDADEEISESLQREILASIKTDIYSGFWIPRKNQFLGIFLRKGGQYPDYTLRLYRRSKGYLPCKNVHEQAVVKGKVGYLKNPLFHFPYPDFSHYLDHYNLYTTILAEEYAVKNIKINFYSFINYIVIKPFLWFIVTYFRHKGFMDGFAGFVFSYFSSLRFLVAYIKYWESKRFFKNV
jgi:glycosyltransferase involved in cell wall biosynthesis